MISTNRIVYGSPYGSQVSVYCKSARDWVWPITERLTQHAAGDGVHGNPWAATDKNLIYYPFRLYEI